MAARKKTAAAEAAQGEPAEVAQPKTKAAVAAEREPVDATSFSVIAPNGQQLVVELNGQEYALNPEQASAFRRLVDGAVLNLNL